MNPRRGRSVLILVDASRSFVDGRACFVARTAEDALALLRRHEFGTIDQLWLDYDLGGPSSSAPLTAQPVVAELVAAARNGTPYSIDEIRIHGRNVSGSIAIKRALVNAGYRVNRDYDLTSLRRTGVSRSLSRR